MTIIETKDITKRYIMGAEVVDALKGVSITIRKGEYVAFMGPSGSGKSTLMNIIGCLDSPTSGTYILNGKDVSDMSENELAEVRNREIGFVFQTFNLLPRQSSLDNVALPLIYAGYNKTDRSEKAQRVLESVGLGDRSSHKPNELSGGQRQRVAVARALVNKPAVVMADEPSGNLDSRNRDELHDLLFSLRNELGQTFVIVTHDDSFAERSDRIIHIKDGVILP